MENEMTMFIIVLRDKENSIISQIGNVDWQGDKSLAMAIAWSRLKEEQAAVCAEVHFSETLPSVYGKKPLAVFTIDDMTDEEKAGPT